LNAYYDYLCIGREIGQLGNELARLWALEEDLCIKERGREQARRAALAKRGRFLGKTLISCQDQLGSLARNLGLDIDPVQR
jgi:hypothetical protein